MRCGAHRGRGEGKGKGCGVVRGGEVMLFFGSLEGGREGGAGDG